MTRTSHEERLDARAQGRAHAGIAGAAGRSAPDPDARSAMAREAGILAALAAEPRPEGAGWGYPEVPRAALDMRGAA